MSGWCFAAPTGTPSSRPCPALLLPWPGWCERCGGAGIGPPELTAIRFEPLRRQHDRDAFAGGVPALDDQGIAGFDSLSMFTLALEGLPAGLARKLPRYEAIPVALIGRLARHQRASGTGLGDLLVADAVLRVLDAARSVAAWAIVVDAKDDHGRAFYASHGFISLPSNPLRLFLLTETAAAARAAATPNRKPERP